MGMRVQWVRYGRDGAEALRAAIAAAKNGEPLEPVTVVIPSNHVGVATRRLLASGVLGSVCALAGAPGAALAIGVGLAAVTFLTPYRLAELWGAAPLAGAGRRPVSTPVIAAAVRAALLETPGVFAPVAAHPATEAALVASYRELREVGPAALDAIARTSARAADVVRLHRATRERLAEAWYDEQDLMASAAGNLPAAGLGPVIVYLPQRLTASGAALFRAVAATSDVVVLAALTGAPAADEQVMRTVRRLGSGDEPAAAATPSRAAVADPLAGI